MYFLIHSRRHLPTGDCVVAFATKLLFDSRQWRGILWPASGCGTTARHAADLGIIPVVIEDACGAGHADAAQRSCEALRFAGDAIMTDTEAFCSALGRIKGT